MLESLINYDKELLIFLNNLGSTQWDGFWLFVTNKFSSIPLYLVLLYFSYKYFGLKGTGVIILAIVLLITVTDQTCNLFKHGFMRLRPCKDESLTGLIRIVKSGCGGYSFFSAHAANSMAVAMFFGLLLKNKVKYLFSILIIWAVVVAYSRVYLGVHFPIDVLTGLICGTIYGSIFYKLVTLVFAKIK